MPVVYTLPCFLKDLDEIKAEVWKHRKQAEEACKRCHDLEKKCPHGFVTREAQRTQVIFGEMFR